jgi:hypothetical protein
MLAEKYVCMYLLNVITTTRPLYEYERQFAICESCFWCATIFHKVIKQEQEQYVIERSNNNPQQQICPTCKNKSISLTPLAKDEIYTIAMEGKRGLEMEFSRRGK